MLIISGSPSEWQVKLPEHGRDDVDVVRNRGSWMPWSSMVDCVVQIGYLHGLSILCGRGSN